MNCEFYQEKICRVDRKPCNDPNFCRITKRRNSEKPLVQNLIDELKPPHRTELKTVIKSLLQNPVLNR